MQAGINLKKLASSAIFAKEDSVRIRLPKAELLNVITNPSDFETFIEKGEWSDAAVKTLKLTARGRLAAKALSLQLIPKANDRARLVVEQLLRSMGFKKVLIISA